MARVPETQLQINADVAQCQRSAYVTYVILKLSVLSLNAEL